MRTKKEIVHSFTSDVKLNEVQKSALLRAEIAFKDLATEVFDLVPDSPDKTVAIRKLFEAKLMTENAITHWK